MVPGASGLVPYVSEPPASPEPELEPAGRSGAMPPAAVLHVEAGSNTDLLSAVRLCKQHFERIRDQIAMIQQHKDGRPPDEKVTRDAGLVPEEESHGGHGCAAQGCVVEHEALRSVWANRRE